MPIQWWKHHCPEAGTHWSANPRPCTQCAEPKTYDGWLNSRFEAMSWYQKTYGLKPIGPHRGLADRLLTGATALCDNCHARGYFDDVDGAAFTPCICCGGAGYTVVIPPGRLAGLIAKVIATYPDAAAPSHTPHPGFSVIVHDIANNVMIVVPKTLNG